MSEPLESGRDPVRRPPAHAEPEQRAQDLLDVEERVFVEQLAAFVDEQGLDEVELAIVAALLRGENQSQAARSAGLARSTFYLRLEQLQERLALFLGREPPCRG